MLFVVLNSVIDLFRVYLLLPTEKTALLFLVLSLSYHVSREKLSGKAENINSVTAAFNLMKFLHITENVYLDIL